MAQRWMYLSMFTEPYPPLADDGTYLARPVVAKNRILLIKELRAFFSRQIDGVSKLIYVQTQLRKIDDAETSGVLDSIVIDWAPLADIVRPFIENVAAAGAALAVDRLEVAVTDAQRSNAKSYAAAWAARRSAELVGMRREGEFLVPTDNAERAIDATTREMLRADIVYALEHDLDEAALAARLEMNYAFSHERAQLIAKTELDNADAMGAVLGWSQTGKVSGKEWQTDGDPCATCLSYEALGVVPLDYEYAPGLMAPTAHPHCQCSIRPYMEQVEIN